MYALYKKEKAAGIDRYTFKNEDSLFGRNRGWIPRLLRNSLNSSKSEPLKWHLDISEALAEGDHLGDTLIIDLKPNDPVVQVWGFSAYGWTPIMMHLRGLFADGERALFNPRDFYRGAGDVEDPIFP